MTFHGLQSSLSGTLAVYEISGIKLQLITVLLELSKPNYSLTATLNQKTFSQIWSHFQLSEMVLERFGDAEQNILPWGQ